MPDNLEQTVEETIPDDATYEADTGRWTVPPLQPHAAEGYIQGGPVVMLGGDLVEGTVGAGVDEHDLTTDILEELVRTRPRLGRITLPVMQPLRPQFIADYAVPMTPPVTRTVRFADMQAEVVANPGARRTLRFSARAKIESLTAVCLYLRDAINAYERAEANWDEPSGIDREYVTPLRRVLRETEAEIAYLENPDRPEEGQATGVDLRRVHRTEGNYPLFVATKAWQNHLLGVAPAGDVDTGRVHGDGDTPGAYAYLQRGG